MHRGNGHPLAGEDFPRLGDHTLRRSEPDQRGFAVGWTREKRRQRLGREGLLFSRPLFHHADADIMVFRQVAVLVVFVAVGHDGDPRLPGNRHRGYAARSDGVPEVPALRVARHFVSVEDPSMNRENREGLRVEVHGRVREVLVGKDDARHLVRFRHFHGVVRKGVRFLHRTGCEDHTGEFTVPRGEGEFQFFLPGACGHPRGGAGTHRQSDHHRRLHHPRKGKSLHHQGETAAGGCHHRARSCVGCADRHVQGRDLVLRLLEDQPEGGAVGGESEQDAAPRRHRVPRGELASSRHRAEGESLVSREDQPGTEGRRGKPECFG